jgi:hypothetical protein
VRREVRKMNRKILIALVVVSFSAIMIVAAVSPAFAHRKKDDLIVVSSGQHGEVILQLPSGVPSHPTCLRFVATDHDKKSEFGPHDSMTIGLWVPQANRFVPVAVIADNPNPEAIVFLKSFWNNTPVWNPIMRNIFNVTDKELDVWEHNDVIKANLTVAKNITLPFNLMVGTPNAAWGNLTFTLPPLTLTFRPIARGFHFEEAGALVPHPPFSGYTIEVESWQSPAWVTAEIPAWSGGVAWELSGHICTHLTETFIPPAT